tara:strand:- start:374 stop:1543 length:1170 start_codon:yes stop_codon:yes gene_type:complete
MMKKICVITGSRADYSLLKNVMINIKSSKSLSLQLVVTGMHLSPKFGLTFKEIEEDGLLVDEKIEMLLSGDKPSSIAKSIGLGTILFSECFKKLSPDMIVLLGDRFEILSCALSAMVLRIPIAHIHGGEVTPHLIDESIRHSITKMSQIHFVSTDNYKKRVIQMGENPRNVHLVGGLGIDNIKKIKFLSKTDLEKKLKLTFLDKNLLVTFHPLTLEQNSSSKQMKQLLSALALLKDTLVIFTMPNADTDGDIIFNLINNFVEANQNARVFTSLGEKIYLSVAKLMDGVVGNSSSGLIEIPSLGVGTVNIGDRQKGRVSGGSVIHCKPYTKSILAAIKKVQSKKFKLNIKSGKNPYGDGGASKKVVKIIERTVLKNLILKEFYDLENIDH